MESPRCVVSSLSISISETLFSEILHETKSDYTPWTDQSASTHQVFNIYHDYKPQFHATDSSDSTTELNDADNHYIYSVLLSVLGEAANVEERHRATAFLIKQHIRNDNDISFKTGTEDEETVRTAYDAEHASLEANEWPLLNCFKMTTTTHTV